MTTTSVPVPVSHWVPDQLLLGFLVALKALSSYNRFVKIACDPIFYNRTPTRRRLWCCLVETNDGLAGGALVATW
jgi:hypothetical protein